VLRLSTRDVTAGFRLYTAEAVRHVLRKGTTCDGYGFQVEAVTALTRAGFTVAEVPISFRDRELGSSKMSLAITIEAAKRCIALARSREFGRAAEPTEVVLRTRPRTEQLPVTGNGALRVTTSPVDATDASLAER